MRHDFRRWTPAAASCPPFPRAAPASVGFRHIGRANRKPFRYIEDRREHLIVGANSRQHHYVVTGYADERGRLLALDAEVTIDGGAYSMWPFSIALEPGQELRDHEVKEAALVLVVSGEARVEAGGETRRAVAGDLFRFDPSERHAVSSEGGARILLTLAPWPGEGHYRGDARAGATAS